jgi:hypothetical protein
MTTNLTDLTVTSLTINGYASVAPAAKVLTGNDTITAADAGVVALNKTSGAITVTLTNPTAVTDDGKRLMFVSLNNVAHIINQASGFGNGGVNEDRCTFSALVGNALHLIAWGGFWYVTGNQNGTIA